MTTHDFPHGVVYGVANARSRDRAGREVHGRRRPQQSGLPGRYAIGGRSDSSTRAVGRRAATGGKAPRAATMTLSASAGSELIGNCVQWHWHPAEPQQPCCGRGSSCGWGARRCGEPASWLAPAASRGNTRPGSGWSRQCPAPAPLLPRRSWSTGAARAAGQCIPPDRWNTSTAHSSDFADPRRTLVSLHGHLNARDTPFRSWLQSTYRGISLSRRWQIFATICPRRCERGSWPLTSARIGVPGEQSEGIPVRCRGDPLGSECAGMRQAQVLGPGGSGHGIDAGVCR
jgi:hypothetical protein